MKVPVEAWFRCGSCPMQWRTTGIDLDEYLGRLTSHIEGHGVRRRKVRRMMKAYRGALLRESLVAVIAEAERRGMLNDEKETG